MPRRSRRRPLQLPPRRRSRLRPAANRNRILPSAADGGRSASSGHTGGTLVARCTFVVLPHGEQVSCTCCVCVRSAAWCSSPLQARICIGDCAHRSPPDWAHTRPHLHRDRVDPLPIICPAKRVHPRRPTSALRKSPPPANICTAAESVPRRHLCHHCCPPGHLPLRNTSVTQQRSTLCCNHMRCVATECHLCTVTIPLRTAPVATGCCAAAPLAAPDPIQAKRSEGAVGRIAWRVRGTVDEDGLLT